MKKYISLISICCFCLLTIEWTALPHHLSSSGEIIKVSRSLSDIDAIINNTLETFNIPGIAVGIVYDGEVLLSKGYGKRDVARDLPFDDQTLVAVASNTKAFTAALLGQLVDEGKVQWDDPVVAYLPDFRMHDPAITDKVTIRDLLAHRTGLPRHDFLWINSDIQRDEVVAKMGFLDLAKPFRQDFLYNNLAYTIAGLIIEKVTGQSWEKNVSQRIFQPLAMTESNATLEDLKNSANFSLPYASIEGQLTELGFLSPAAIAPAAAVNSNVRDMLKWIAFQLSDGQVDGMPLMQSKTLEETHTLQIPIVNQASLEKDIYPLGYALGWFNGIYRNYFYLEHGGSLDGFITQVSLLPQKKIGVVVCTNSSSDGTFVSTSLAKTIIDKLLGEAREDWMQLALQERMESKNKFQTANMYGVHSALSSQPILDEYVGEYEHPGYGQVSIWVEDNRLKGLYGSNEMNFVFQGDDTFTWKVTPYLAFGDTIEMPVHFERGANGIIQLSIPFESSVAPIAFKR